MNCLINSHPLVAICINLFDYNFFGCLSSFSIYVSVGCFVCFCLSVCFVLLFICCC